MPRSRTSQKKNKRSPRRARRHSRFRSSTTQNKFSSMKKNAKSFVADRIKFLNQQLRIEGEKETRLKKQLESIRDLERVWTALKEKNPYNVDEKKSNKIEKELKEIQEHKKELSTELDTLGTMEDKLDQAYFDHYLTKNGMISPSDMCDMYTEADLQVMNKVNAAYKCLYSRLFEVNKEFPTSLFYIQFEGLPGKWDGALKTLEGLSGLANLTEIEKSALKVLRDKDYDHVHGTKTALHSVLQNTNFSHVQALIGKYSGEKGFYCQEAIKTHLEQTNLQRLQACLTDYVAKEKGNEDRRFLFMVTPKVDAEDIFPFYTTGSLARTTHTNQLTLKFFSKIDETTNDLKKIHEYVIPKEGEQYDINSAEINDELFTTLSRTTDDKPSLAWIWI